MSTLRRDLLPLVREAFAASFIVEAEVGRGGAARVYRATTHDGRIVALKVLHPELAATVTADRFLREISLVQRIDHPLITEVLDSGQAGIFLYYVMPFVEGQSLRAHLERVQRLDIADGLRLGVDLLDALAAAHAQGIVHRDVKPENVLVTERGAILVDFGIARALAQAGGERLTRSGIAVGTSGYMSPEQIQAMPLDARTDLYGVGCLLFEAMSGRPPFIHRSEHVVLQMHMRDEPPELVRFRGDAPVALSEAIRRALAKDPAERFPTARAMQAVLSSLLEGAAPAS